MLLFAPCSCWRLLSGWSSLRLRVLGGYWISPLCSLDRRYDSRSTCSALPHVSRLSFVLGEFSWLGFGLCLAILLAPWGCRHAYCGPHCGSESARVLPSLLGPSPLGVRHLSRVCSSVGGPVGVAHSFHPSLLLGGVLFRFADALWLCLERALRLFFASVSLVDPVALSPFSRSVSTDGFRHWWALALAEGHLPMSWVLS